MNIIILYTLDLTNTNYIAFLSNYSNILFNFIYFLTFSSVVGAGVKFLNIYKTCK